jgi:PAS domain S-box-containing protein
MSIISIPLVVLASSAFSVCIYHLLIFLRRRQDRKDLIFALMCLTIGIYDVLCAGLYNVTSTADGAHWQRLQLITLSCINITFIWFITYFTHQEPNKWLYILSLVFFLGAMIQIVDRSNLTWLVDRPAIKAIMLPFGLKVTYYEVTQGTITSLQGPIAILAGVYVFWSGIRFYKRGFKREAGRLLIALCIVYAAVFNDTAVSEGIYANIYLMEYGFMATILLMAYSIWGTVVEATKVKESLLESEGRFRTIVEYSHSGILTINNNFEFTYINEQLCNIFGYTHDELIGKDFRSFLDGESKEMLEERYFRLQKGETVPARFEMNIIRKDGSERIVEMSAATTVGAVGDIHMIGQALDITERKKIETALSQRAIENAKLFSAAQEELQERKRIEIQREALIKELEAKNNELERFTYTVSHDLKSPLVTIRGFLGYLEKDAVKGDIDRLKADIERISVATDKMQLLLNELLELSRIGRIMNPPVDVQFTQLAHEAVDLVQGQIQKYGVKVKITDNMASVFGDRARLLEIVQNLVDNAVKFMGNQTNPYIEIGQDGDDVDGKPIFFVQDNGIGIEPQYHERIFGLFNKLDTHTEGTGIGLALVKRIVEVHGGRIWVESQGTSMGSKFSFSLPQREKSTGTNPTGTYRS